MSDNKLAEHERFAHLTYADFKKMAEDDSLTCYEKIGFPNALRESKEELIFQDISTKLTHLRAKNKIILDIGSGCSQLPHKLIELCGRNEHQLCLIDSQEMLNQLPDTQFLKKIPAFYPNTCRNFLSEYQHRIDVVLAYSVVQYIFAEANLFEFIDESLSLLNEGGQLLIGDIPNSSKRKRFLNSARGVKHHQTYYDASTVPQVQHLTLEPKQIDDGVLMGIVMRCRNAGYDAYLIPQAVDLPMANRREDLLIIKP